MGSLFRSEEMRLCQLFLQTEAAYACVSELGEIGLVQFKDLNANVNAFQRTFVNEVRRCEEMERKLRYTEKEILKEDWKIPDYGENPKAPFPKEMNDLEVEFEKMDNELRQVNTNNEAIKQNYLELTELREVLTKTRDYLQAYGQDIQQIMDGDAPAQPPQNEEAVIGTSRAPPAAALGYHVGTILREKVPVFERVLKFVTHSNVYLRTEEIAQPLEDPITGDMLKKSMFIMFYQGDQLKNKCKKVCEGLRGTVYPLPDDLGKRADMLVGVTTRLADLENVLAQSRDHRLRVLENARKELRSWIIKVEKIKAIYHTMNMFKVHQNSLIAECWFPLRAIDDIRNALSLGEKVSGSSIPSVIQPMDTHEAPPTYYNSNKFVKGFQNIVDAYGVGTYQEVNPAPYTCITFPFLFAVMFGDAGHGLIMFLFGLWMCISEKSLAAKKISNEIWNTFFGGRYIIMMMGLFSFYTGIIYNDAFSKSFNIFGSEWKPNMTEEELLNNEQIELDPAIYHINSSAYLVGVDPIWQSAKNKIMFLNSLKMKMAIVLGVIHMMFGVVLSIFNHVHFKRKIDILIKFLPEMLFLTCLFGYLVALIFYKWLTFDAVTSMCAPSLLIHFINMFMLKYTDPTPGNPCDSNNTFYDGQQAIQTTLLLIALLSVPVLLIVRPVYQVCAVKRAKKAREVYRSQHEDPLISNEVLPGNIFYIKLYEVKGQVNPAYQPDSVGNGRPLDPPANIGSLNSDEEENLGMSEPHADHGGHEDTGEIVIEGAIETIEFCLGCISHTASYLRLWALSLAHAELSEVLWSMVLHMGFSIGGDYVGGVVLFVIFFVWANLTVAILLLMEGLSAFLHTLRLHWVEFQSKFYDGDGYHFQPFTFHSILTMESLEEASA
ncbi:V-type proton ATPase 116 kDa subunit a1 isoform X2 [Aplysia californica]|uniref:V-type proton ATPase subunit a n=1 Tax=Aplysia californica TaxID=6500 RepID=A0ABM1AAG2_APLCA|nr:V-type proton ATPase 116 kDa subunit a1 isoform X2 [Aplysia californica]